MSERVGCVRKGLSVCHEVHAKQFDKEHKSKIIMYYLFVLSAKLPLFIMYFSRHSFPFVCPVHELPWKRICIERSYY